MLFRFQLPTGYSLALPTGQHITIKGQNADGDVIMRQYTPTTNEKTIGHFDVVIKIYPNGQLGNYLKNLPLNSDVEIKGPFGAFSYKGDGVVGIKRTRDAETIYNIKNLGMIAGGSGLTPMYQIIQNLTDSNDSLKMNLVYGNQTKGDIICRDELDCLAKRNTNFKVWYTVDKCTDPSSWCYHIGFMNADVFKAQLPPPSKETLIVLCGPPGLIGFAEKLLKEIGFTEDMIFVF